MAITTTQPTEIVTVVVGLFNAAPGTVYLDEFSSYAGAPAALVNDLVATDAFLSLYPADLTDAEFSAAFIEALIGGAAAASEIQWATDWMTGLLGAGGTRGEVVFEAISALAAVPTDDPLFGDAAAQFNNKVVVAEYYSTDFNGAAVTLDALQAVLANVTADSDVSTDAAIEQLITGEEPVDPGVPGEEIYLTSGTDRGADFVGSANNDTFYAYIEQNPFAGGVSNSLSSADILDGGAGRDTLIAEVVPEFVGVVGGVSEIDIQPRTTSIEIAKFEARDISVGSFGNNIVTVDAKNMVDVDTIGSSFSDGDLVIENLTTRSSTGDARNTDTMTVVMEYTDNDNSDDDASDLVVLFDEDYLITDASTTGATLLIRLVNNVTNVDNLNPIVGTAGLSFSVGDTLVVVDLTEVAADATLNSETAYDAVVDAINARLAELGLTTVSAAKEPRADTVFSIPVTAGGNDYDVGDDAGQYNPILITNTGPEPLTEGQFQQAETESDTNIAASQTDNPAVTQDNPLAINIDLEKVGRAGEGGHLIIGGKELGATGQGITVFNIDVLGDNSKPSDLEFIASTNGDLEEVYIETATEFVASAATDAGVADLTVDRGFGNLADGNYAFGGYAAGFAVTEMAIIDSTDFLGDLSVGSAASRQQAIDVDLGVGDDTFWWTSVEANGVSSGKAYNINLGAGDDVTNIALDGDSVDALGESFTLITGTGDDTAIISEADANGGGNGVSQQTMVELENISIDLGAGDDTLTMNNEFNAEITAGSGDDLVYMQAQGLVGAIAVGNATGPQAFGERVLYNATLTVSFGGFESQVRIPTDATGNFIADQNLINLTIINAIESDPVLSKLLTTTLNEGTQQLTITSLFEGSNSFGVAIYQPVLVAANAAAGQTVLAGSDLAAFAAGIIETTALDSDDLVDVATAVAAVNGLNWEGAVNENGVGDNTLYTQTATDVEVARGAQGSDILDLANDNYVDYVAIGTDSATGINLSTIEMGPGTNDIVVMHSNDANLGTLKFTGEFGKVSVLNWHDDATHTIVNAVQMGQNALDFTEFLDNQIDPSATAGTTSAVDVAVTTNIVAGAEAVNGLSPGVTNNNIAVANSINVIRFIEDVAAGETFESLTAAQLLQALNNGGTDYGNLTDNLLDAQTVAAANTVIGGTLKQIIMVEDSTNEGSYKVFSTTSVHDVAANANGDFATATLLGEIDFGASVNVIGTGSAKQEQIQQLLLDLAEVYEGAGLPFGVSDIEFDAAGNYNVVADVTGLSAAQATALQAAVASSGLTNATLNGDLPEPPVEPPVEPGTVQVGVPVTVEAPDFTASAADGDFVFLVTGSPGEFGVSNITITDFSAGDQVNLDAVGIETNIGGIDLLDISATANAIDVTVFSGNFADLQTWSVSVELEVALDAATVDAINLAGTALDLEAGITAAGLGDWFSI